MQPIVKLFSTQEHRDRLVAHCSATRHRLLISCERYSTGMCHECLFFYKQGATKTFVCRTPGCTVTAHRDGGATGKILARALRFPVDFKDAVSMLYQATFPQ
jgi:hypothetical protein